MPIKSGEQSLEVGHAEQVYKDLLAKADHARSRKSLEQLWAALEQMQADEVPDYSLARVGKYTDKMGGPKAQSIRNENGAKFRELIDAFARTAGKARARTPAHPPSNVERAIEMIPDMAARVALKMMLEDRRRLQIENNDLRSAFKRLSVAPTRPEEPRGQVEVLGAAAGPQAMTLDPAAISAINRFLASDWFEERLWTVDPDGSISDDATGGDMIAPPGFVDALRSIVQSHADHGNDASSS